MAADTPLALRNALVYQVDPRTFGATGKLAEIAPQLPRIRALGADILYLMPFYPIGEKNRLGRFGSSYCIRDHRAVNPDLGTLADVRRLADAVHGQGMRLVIDAVFNHASQDCVLFDRHPGWMCRTADGGPARKIEEWTDAVDLDWSHRGLWDWMLGTLEHWVDLGVDGFRCDVAAMVPLGFWIEARARIAARKPGAVWIAESSSPGGILRLRNRGYASSSDAELYQAFDACYDYDIHHLLRRYFAGEADLEPWLEALRRQAYTYPANFVKLRFLENHDLERFAVVAKSRAQLVAWTALLFFLQGTTMIFAGQEHAMTVRMDSGDLIPHLDWSRPDEELAGLFTRLAAMKKHPAFAEGVFTVRDSGRRGVAYLALAWKDEVRAGIFNVEGRHGTVATGLADGTYGNLCGGEAVTVKDGAVTLRGDPMIFTVPARG